MLQSNCLSVSTAEAVACNRHYSTCGRFHLICILKLAKCMGCPHSLNPMAIFACISEVLHGARIYSIGTSAQPYKGADSSHPNQRLFNQGACTEDLSSRCSCWNQGRRWGVLEGRQALGWAVLPKFTLLTKEEATNVSPLIKHLS